MAEKLQRILVVGRSKLYWYDVGERQSVIISGSDESVMLNDCGISNFLSTFVRFCRFIGELTLSAIRGNTRPVDVIQIKVNFMNFTL